MPNDIDALFETRAGTAASDGQINRISELINQEADLRGEIETLEAALKEAGERSRAIRHVELPKAMLDAQMREFTADNGLKAKVVFITDGSLGSAKTEEERQEKEAKLDCIIAHGGGEIIKQTVTLTFPKEMVEEAEAIRVWLVDQVKKRAAEKSIWGLVSVNRERSVHHQTLCSWIKEKMGSDRAEDQLPPAFFERIGMWYGEAAKLFFPKKG